MTLISERMLKISKRAESAAPNFSVDESLHLKGIVCDGPPSPKFELLKGQTVFCSLL